ASHAARPGKGGAGSGERFPEPRGAATGGDGVRSRPDRHRGSAVQRARRDSRRVWVWDGGTGAARVVGRRHRIAAFVRSRLAALRRSDRADHDSPRKDRGTGGGGSWGGGAACRAPTTPVS